MEPGSIQLYPVPEQETKDTNLNAEEKYSETVCKLSWATSAGSPCSCIGTSVQMSLSTSNILWFWGFLQSASRKINDEDQPTDSK